MTESTEQSKATVLVIAPHPDDESIGCGGTLYLHASRQERIAAVFLSSGELGLKELPPQEAWRIREREAEDAAAILGIAALNFLRFPDWHIQEHTDGVATALRPILEREAPQRIYLPHPQEWHPDHQASLPAVRKALRASRIPSPTLLGYEVWTPLAEYDDGSDITLVLKHKLQAVRCHRSQVGQLRYDRAVVGLNKYRGTIAWGCRYAEVFRHLGPVTSETEGI